MPFRDKILFCLVPYLLAFILWFSLAGQAFSDWQDKDKQISEKSKEEVDLRTRLFQLTKLQKQKTQLLSDIEQLRSAVPKSPNLDILLIDLEKMCLSSGMDLVGVEKASEKKIADMTASDAEDESNALTPGKVLAGGKNREGAKAPVGKRGAKPSPEKVKPSTPEEEVGLSKVVLDTQVIGDYPSLVELMKKLEAYQRVIAVNHISVQVPTKDSKVSGDPANRLKISFLITAYYLP